MIKLLDFMKKHKIWMTIFSLLFSIIPPIAVHFLFKMKSTSFWMQPEWTAGDLLTYIAGFEAFIGTVSLGLLSFWQNYQIQEQHIESQKPLLSMNLIDEDSILYLTIENTGGVEAKNIKIEVIDICNNGDEHLFLDKLFNSTFELYPREKVKGRIAINGENCQNETCPQINLKVSYTRPDLNKTNEVTRSVTFSGKSTQNTNKDNFENKIGSELVVIARANTRIANYLDGHQVLTSDEFDLLADRSLRNDLADAMKTKQETHIFNRNETIKKTQSISSVKNNGKTTISLIDQK